MAKVKWTVYRGRGTRQKMSDATHAKRVKRLLDVAQGFAKSVGLVVYIDDRNVTFCRETDKFFADTLSVLVSPTDGVLVPDGWEGDDGGYGDGYCDEAPWKAAACAELLAALHLDAESKKHIEYARSVFAGEIAHPAVVYAMR